jgi:hypothetical protein
MDGRYLRNVIRDVTGYRRGKITNTWEATRVTIAARNVPTRLPGFVPTSRLDEFYHRMRAHIHDVIEAIRLAPARGTEGVLIPDKPLQGGQALP